MSRNYGNKAFGVGPRTYVRAEQIHSEITTYLSPPSVFSFPHNDLSLNVCKFKVLKMSTDSYIKVMDRFFTPIKILTDSSFSKPEPMLGVTGLKNIANLIGKIGTRFCFDLHVFNCG